MNKNYLIDSKNASQTLSVEVNADKEKIFRYLSTSDGISSWFPQLQMKKEEDEQFVLFDLGDGTFEKMKLIDYKTNQHISYEWASGKVAFDLKDIASGTQLTLKEELPLTFSAIPEDFTGWYVLMQQIKAVSETGKPAKLSKDEIAEVKNEIRSKLSE